MCYAVSTRNDPDENSSVNECAVPRFSDLVKSQHIAFLMPIKTSDCG